MKEEASFITEARERRRLNGAGPAWPEPDLSLLDTRRTPAPACLLQAFGPWEGWIRDHAEVASAPVDYVAGALLCAAGIMVAKTLWTSPWPGWRAPPSSPSPCSTPTA